VLELAVAGPAAQDAHREAMRQFAERYRASFEQARAERPELREPNPEALIVLCAGTEHLVAERLRAGRADELEALEDVFCECAESVLLGPARDPDGG
jgi:rhamnose utilization protein RhaD (predicted bifunctional aldolase and dehydrogenase)